MAWFGKSQDDADAALLRQALIDVLAHLGERAEGRSRTRLQRVASRLERPPLPTGLRRELASVLARLEDAGAPTPAPVRREDDAEVMAEMAGALTDALSASALLDRELFEAIDTLEEGLPPRVGRGDARRIVRAADDVRAIAGPARDRAQQTRAQVLELVSGIAAEVAPALQHTGAIEWGITELREALSTPAEPEALMAMRSDLLMIVRDLAGTSNVLRGQIVRANERVNQLERSLAETQSRLSQTRMEADQDPLTGLPHRGTFDRRLIEAVRSSRQHGRAMALVLFDIDHFKQVNDTHGHPVGDEVLKAVAARLQAQVRGGDTVARIGGEEFAVLLCNVEHDTVVDVVERIRQAIEADGFNGESGRFHVTASAGVAFLVDDETPRALVKRADRALYQAKEAGRNRFVEAA